MMILAYSSLDSLEAVESTCNQLRLSSDCADAQADLSLRWLHKSYCRFCHVLADMVNVLIFQILYSILFWPKVCFLYCCFLK